MLARSSRRTLIGVALPALLATVGACGGSSAGPHSLPPLSPSSTVSTTTASSPAASGNKAELAAATAVVRRYYLLLEQISHHMDAAPFAALMSPRCSCRKFLDSIRRLHARNEHYFGSAHILAIQAVSDGPRLAEVLVRYNASPGGVATSTGKVIKRSPKLRAAALNYRLRRTASHWLIDQVDIVNRGT